MPLKRLYAGIIAASMGASIANAASLTPTFQTFGDLSQATFGGTGIPTEFTAFSTFLNGAGDSITLGLSATQRFANPPLANDGAGTYTALPGSNTGGPGSSSSLVGALWNFSFFAGVTDNGGGSTLGDFDVKLLYDFDPGVGTDDSALGELDFDTLPISASSVVGDLLLAEGSQNLNFAFLGASAAGITPPTFGSFNPNAPGEYSFALRSNAGDVAINVNVVPLPATAWLLLSAFAGLGFLSRVRRKSFA